MKETMQIFAAVGPLGAGKTTFVLNVIQALESRGFPTRQKVAYVVNDEGGLIDGELASKSAEVVAMTNGCFTCTDTADLKRTLVTLEQSGITWVFLEGFGITAGNETRKFLESSGYQFHIFCLLSAKHHALDLIRYADVVKSQVKAATLAVGVTKYQGWVGSLLDRVGRFVSKCVFPRAPFRLISTFFQVRTFMNLLDDGVIPEFVARENPGIPVILVPNGSDIPSTVIDIFERKVERKTRRTGLTVSRTHNDDDHTHHTGCGCTHHHHVHNMHPYSFELRDNVTLSDIKKAFAGKDFLLRIKGSVEGSLFNEVHGDWKQTVDDPRRFVTFYASREVEIASDLPDLEALVVIEHESIEDEPSYAQLRKETATREDTVREIKALLGESPSEPILLDSPKGLRIITHPEVLQTAKEISRRPYVKDEWFPQVLTQFMEYWIKCADIVRIRESEIVPEDIAKNRYELAVSMVWWVNRYGEFFGPEIIQAVERLRPGAMAAEGIRSLQSLIAITPPETVSWQCLEFTEALSYGLAHGDNPESIIEAARHCLALATTPELRRSWSESLERLTEELGKILA